LGANDAGVVKLWHNRTYVGEERNMGILSGKYTDKAIEWITNHIKKETGQPFFFYLCHTMMHTIIDASLEFRNRKGNGLYADAMEELDHEIGRLISALDDLGLRENTLVFFTSDNGAWSNDAGRQNPKNAKSVEWTEGPQMAVGSNKPLREGKGSCYEGGVRVPCIARWPGRIPSGRESAAIFGVIDLMPTFAGIAGYNVPEDRVIDGADQSDLLLGISEQGARSIHFCRFGSHAVRMGKWKLMKPERKPMPRKDKNGKLFVPSYPADWGSNDYELYNLEEDIGEQNDLLEKYPEVVERLMKLEPVKERQNKNL
jgi:arylsulfatase A-like enzyme